MERFSLANKKGRRNLLVLLLIVLFACSLLAQLVSSNFGSVKIESVSFDARGALINGDLYYPAGTSDKDSLPCIILCHGGAINHSCMRGIGEELARRGYVVLNFSAYGAGISEQPPYDDMGQGKDEYNVMNTTAGALDALAFVRTLKFVDQTKIGMAGHSMGSIRTGAAAMADCGYLTLNDQLINVLYDTFGQTFTEQEIYEDADQLAAARLSADQMARYEEIRAEVQATADTRLRSIMLIGAHGNNVTPLQTVTVGGHEVQRNCNVNMGVVSGTWDDLSSDYAYYTFDYVKEAWYTNGENAVLETWYSVNDQEGSSKQLGNFNAISILDSESLSNAIANRDARICMLNQETHSHNFFSRATTRDIVRYFEQTMDYNRGALTDPTTVPLAAENVIFHVRAVLNFISLLCMVLLLVPLATMLVHTESFASCGLAANAAAKQNLSKRRYYIVAAITVAVVFTAQYFARANGSAFIKKLPSTYFNLATSSGPTFLYLVYIAIFSLALLAALCAFHKKEDGTLGLEALNLWPGLKTVVKSIFLGALLVGAGYLCLMLITYWFNQEFRFLQLSFSLMKADYWVIALRYGVFLLPLFLVIGAAVNYTIRTDIPQWKDTLITVVVNSLGMYLLFALNLIIAATSFNGSLFASFNSSHPMLVMVPVTCYLSRKLYLLTKNLWIGATVNAGLVCWNVISSMGIYNYYTGQTFLGNLLGL